MHFRQNKDCFFIVIFLGVSKTFCNFGTCFPLEVQPGGGILISYNAPAYTNHENKFNPN